LRAAERFHAPRGRNAQRIDRRLLWLLTPAALAGGVILFLASASGWTWLREAEFALLSLASGCLLLTLASQERFWWAPRLLAGLICLSLMAAVYRSALFPFAGIRDPHLPALFLAAVGFMLWGLPCLCFALWGHTGGKLARADAAEVTRMDRWSALLLEAVRFGVYIALGFYLAQLLLG
jgi:hypothetical protein